VPSPPISLILPTLNERENVERFVPALLTELPSICEIVIVDDGSVDGTPEAAERLGLSDPRVKLLRRSAPPSLSAAIAEGIAAAKGELIGWTDADLVIAPRDLGRLVEAVRGGADVAIGSRFAPGGRIKGQHRDGVLGRVLALANLRTTADSALGVFLSWALNAVVLPPLVGAPMRDYTSGIIVAKRAALEGVELRGHHGEYFIHLWATLLAGGANVVEVPYRVQPRRYGRSKTGNNLRDYAVRGRRYLEAGIAAGALLRAGKGRTGDETMPARRASSAAKRTSR
jgi:dolichol-phosphate mannosyltransferase